MIFLTFLYISNIFLMFFTIFSSIFQQFSTNIFNLPHRLDENPDLMALHIGDRVIDVNGHSVQNSSSLKDIQKIIDDTDRVLQLTIEHEPNTITRRNPISGELEFLTTQAVSRNASSSSIDATSPPPPKLDKARIAMRMDEGYMSGTPKKFNKLQRNQKPSHQKHQRKYNCQQSSNSLRDGKERSSSMSASRCTTSRAPKAFGWSPTALRTSGSSARPISSSVKCSAADSSGKSTR
jgi:hypothetical protein